MLIFILLSATVRLRSQETKLLELRQAFARRYLQPNAHFALAKYYLEHGEPLQAFFIMEYARRYRFEEKDFDSAYIAFFGDPMAEPPDEAKTSFEAASKLVAHQKYDEAEILFEKAYARYDKSFFINAWIGRFYYKAKADGARALPFYFKSYFLYPHAYETEYVESRIRAISIAEAESSFKALLNSGKSVSELARHQNPIIAGMAVEEMGKSWKPEYAAVLLEAMNNDDSIVRWGAFATLHKFAGPSWEKIVDNLLTDADLRKRGLAAYAVIERTGPEKFQTLKKMLGDQAELVRFDAVSALAMGGGPTGKQILKEHQAVEKQPRLKSLIDKALKDDSR